MSNKLTGRARMEAAFKLDMAASGGAGAVETLAAVPPLITALRVSNGALKSDTLPTRIKILNWGDNDSTKGNFRVGQRTLEKLAANQRAIGFERVALDFAHCSIEGSEEHKNLLTLGRPPMIFGYGRPNVVAGEGVYLEEMKWTPLGVESARQFEDLSPAVHDVLGEVDFVHSVALTPNGCVHGLTFFSASASRAGQLTGKDRMQAAFELENAGRGQRGQCGLARLSVDGIQASTSAGQIATLRESTKRPCSAPMKSPGPFIP
jgi:hypothetical protein